MPTTRCTWCTDDPLYQAYHDTEWGRPVHDDQTLFEFLCLEGAQAGLSWITILKKRENYRKAYRSFDVSYVASLDESDHQQLLENPGIIRNKRKVAAFTQNAKAFLNVQKEYGSFDAYIWAFVNGVPQLNTPKTSANIPAHTQLAATISKDLKKRGFTFVGPTIVYAFMQATGMVNDHTEECFLAPSAAMQK